MASAHKEHLYQDDFGAVFDILESDIFWNMVMNFNKIWILQLKKYLH